MEHFITYQYSLFSLFLSPSPINYLPINIVLCHFGDFLSDVGDATHDPVPFVTREQSIFNLERRPPPVLQSPRANLSTRELAVSRTTLIAKEAFTLKQEKVSKGRSIPNSLIMARRKEFSSLAHLFLA